MAEMSNPAQPEPQPDQVAPTKLLYQTDGYLKRFEARVVAVSGTAIALDQTAFFPGGGGQMADRGELVVEGRCLPLATLRKEGEIVWHEVAPEQGEQGPLPAVGQAIIGELDWPFRYRMMRTHTALHTLTAIIFRNYGAQVTGGQMYPDRARMDFAMETFTPALAHDIEADVNSALAEGHPVKVYFLPRERAFAIPDLIRTKINLLPPAIQTIRIVEIVGVDLQADGGTHVANSGEVGKIRVLRTENKGKINKRMEIALEE
jgi:misacylated tRNA(Ala) deacylase